MQEKLKELTTQFRNGEIQDEKEYNDRIASMQEYYTEKMEKDSLCSHRCPSVKGKLQRGGSNSRYRTRCCNRTVQDSGYDVDTEIFSGGKIHGLF